jgi:flagellin-like hook-associated protein FlgL
MIARGDAEVYLQLQISDIEDVDLTEVISRLSLVDLLR